MYKKRWEKAVKAFRQKYNIQPNTGAKKRGQRKKPFKSDEERSLDAFLSSADAKIGLELMQVTRANRIWLGSFDRGLSGYVFMAGKGFALETWVSSNAPLPVTKNRRVSTRDIVNHKTVTAKQLITYILSEIDKIASRAPRKRS